MLALIVTSLSQKSTSENPSSLINPNDTAKTSAITGFHHQTSLHQKPRAKARAKSGKGFTAGTKPRFSKRQREEIRALSQATLERFKASGKGESGLHYQIAASGYICTGMFISEIYFFDSETFETLHPAVSLYDESGIIGDIARQLNPLEPLTQAIYEQAVSQTSFQWEEVA